MYKKKYITIDFLPENETVDKSFYSKINLMNKFLSKIDNIDKQFIGKKL